MNSCNPKVSIIVPAYNVENYIKKCIDSLIKQTYKNIEIIVVNDGSKDNTLKVLNNYLKKDKRICIIDQKNEGVSAARNNALAIATGEYVVFVDSDDWLEIDFCEKMLKATIDTNADIGMCGYLREYKEKSLPKGAYKENTEINSKDEIIKIRRNLFGPIGEELNYPDRINIYASLWCKIYKTKLIKSIKIRDLDEVGICEDGFFNIEVMKSVNKIMYINEFLYHYRKVEGGNSLTHKPEKKVLDREIRFYNCQKKVIEKENLEEEYLIAIKNRLAINLVGMGLNLISNSSKPYKNLKEILNNDLYKECLKNLELNNMSLKWKCFYWNAKYKVTIMVYILLKIMNYLKKLL